MLRSAVDLSGRGLLRPLNYLSRNKSQISRLLNPGFFLKTLNPLLLSSKLFKYRYTPATSQPAATKWGLQEL
jgi:hypothetical protein